MHNPKREAPSPKPSIKKSRAAIVLSVISVLFIALSVLGIWLMRRYLADPQLVREKIGEHYWAGALATILISAIQVTVALIPGEFVEIAAGYCFGSWIGSLLCLLGIVLGSCTTILLV